MGVYPNVFAPYRDTLDQYQAWLSQCQLSPLEAVLSFLKTQDQIDYVVMGVTSLDELKQIINTKSVRLSRIPPAPTCLIANEIADFSILMMKINGA